MTIAPAHADDGEVTSPTALRPPLRWVGGKRKMAADLAARCEARRALVGRYFEPFLGSGAVALAMPPGIAMTLADACKPLGYLWWWLQREPEAIAEYAAAFGIEIGENWNDREGYVEVRLSHNCEPFVAEDWQPSARFLWLMHASFNGIYRENRQGYYNVPWGNRRVGVPSSAELRAIADRIGDAAILPGWDFADTLADVTKGDVVFVDPPYDGDSSAFTNYVATPFGAPEQVRLAEVLDNMVGRGAAVVHTNADTPRIRALYRHWKIEEVFEARPVAADPQKRVPAACLILTKEGRR
jgi:DNA adenine methylase